MPKVKNIKKVKEKYEVVWLQLKGVEGVGIGQMQNKPCINVYISQKSKQIEETIPGEIDGITVALITSGKFQAF